MQSIKDILSAGSPIKFSSTNSITRRFQDEALRCATELKISEFGEYRSRWFRLFKEADSRPELYARVYKLKSYLSDYYPFNQLEGVGKIKYFFKLFNNGIGTKTPS